MEKEGMSHMSNKSEKLASAVYLVTGFFPEQEPLKWKLRSLSTQFVSVGIFLKDGLFGERQEYVLQTRNIVLEIITLLSVAKNAGLVSDMNHNLLNQEFSKYLETLNLNLSGKISDISEKSLLPKAFTEDESALVLGRTQAQPLGSEKREPTEPQVFKGQKLDEHTLAHMGTKSEPKSLKEFGAVLVKKNSRQSIIINLLKRKKEIMIKDVTPLIHGCSEKTIQRELLTMVQAGIIKKEGEKRWSRYSLS